MKGPLSLSMFGFSFVYLRTLHILSFSLAHNNNNCPSVPYFSIGRVFYFDINDDVIEIETTPFSPSGF